MSMLKFAAFGGMVPRATKRDLPDSAAQVADNLFADTMEFRPLATDTAPQTIGIVGPDQVVRTMYRYPTSSSTIVGTDLQGTIVRSTIPDDKFDRVYGSTLSSESAEHPPALLQTGLEPADPTLRRLGVEYPTAPLTLALATVDDALLKPSEATAFRASLLQTIRDIVAETFEAYLWNGAFDLDTRAGFRPAPGDTTGAIWQRIFTHTVATNTWNVYNGQPVSRFLYVAEARNPPFYVDSPGVHTYYVNFPAKATLLRIKTDITVQVNKLKALVVPNTTSRLITDAEIDSLFALLRTAFPQDPLDTKHPEILNIAGQIGAEYTKLVSYLDTGFDASVTPQTGYRLAEQAINALMAGMDALAALYQDMARQFDKLVLDHYRQTRIPGKIPEGELEQIEVRYYTYTLVNEYGEESKPYLPGDGNTDTDLPYIAVNQTQLVSVTRPALPSWVPTTWKWRIYRSATGAQASGFFLVAEAPVSVSNFADLRPSDALSEPLQTMTWFPPPAHGTAPNLRYLKNLVQMPGQFLAGFVDNTVYFSEPNHPYAWPRQYAIPLNDDVVALGVFGATLVALTKGRPVYISGGHPESVSRVDLESVESCVSPRSVVPVSGGVVFASQNGLCMATQAGIVNMTGKLYTRDEWEALGPAGMACAEHDGVIYFTRPALGKMGALHVQSGKLATLDLNPTALYSDHSTGALYAALAPAAGQVAKYVQILKGTGARTARWRSKRIVLPAEAGFAWLAVEGEQSPATPLRVDIYGYYVDPVTGNEHADLLETEAGDGTYSAVVVDTRPLRVGTGRYKDFEVEVSGQCRVTSVVLVSSLDELKGVN